MVPHDPQHDPGFAADSIDTRAYSREQLFFLARLLKLLRLRQQRAKQHETDAPRTWRTKLLGKAIYSTYCDCVALGVGREARSLLDQYSSGKRVSP